jgi:cytochrome c oxidase subunit 4
MTGPRSSSDSSGRFILGAGVVLLVLAATSYGASFLALGRWAIAVALGIAVVKAGIVVGVFMEAARRSASFLLALCAAVVLLATLIALVAADVAFRGPSPIGAPRPSSRSYGHRANARCSILFRELPLDRSCAIAGRAVA